MAEEVAKCSREPRFRSSSLRFLSPEDREKARALPNIPPAPESFKRCFLYFLEKGEVLAEAKAEPSEQLEASGGGPVVGEGHQRCARGFGECGYLDISFSQSEAEAGALRLGQCSRDSVARWSFSGEWF